MRPAIEIYRGFMADVSALHCVSSPPLWFVCCSSSPELSLDWVWSILSGAPSEPYGPLPDPLLSLKPWVREVRVFSAPAKCLEWLPEASGEPMERWSQFARVMAEGDTWSTTGLLRRMHQELVKMQREAEGAAPLPPKPFNDDPCQLMRLYIQELRKSIMWKFYTKRLDGEQVQSPFSLEGWWVCHQLHCSICRNFGDWDYAKSHNESNPCYMADLLACLHHGFLLPFKSIPTQQHHANYPTLEMAPEAAAAEWLKMESNHVVLPEEEALEALASAFPNEPRQDLHCSAPMLAVVKPADTDEAFGELARLGHTSDLQEDNPTGLVDRLNAALRDFQSTLEVKARLCTDFGKTVNPHLRECPFAFHPVDGLLELLRPGPSCAKWITGAASTTSFISYDI